MIRIEIETSSKSKVIIECESDDNRNIIDDAIFVLTELRKKEKKVTVND